MTRWLGDDESARRRRAAGEPVQYIVGSWAFRSLELRCDPRALIPRPETELLVDLALGAHTAPVRVCDLGTGTGALALALALEGGHRLMATDVSAAALDLAADNCARYPEATVELALGSWFEALPSSWRGTLDLVVSNPPYVAVGDEVDPEVTFEPEVALYAGDGSDGTPGMAEIEVLLRGAADWLAPEGVFLCELSPPQAEPSRQLATSLGLDASIERDLTDRPRFVVARRR